MRFYVKSKRSSVSVFVVVIFCFLKGVAAHSTITDYNVVTYSKSDGLPQNSVTAITQTENGFLWIGTYSGLAKFDGLNFSRPNNSELAHERITYVLEASNQVLWIGTENNGVYRMEGDSVFHFTPNDIIPLTGVEQIVELKDSKIAFVSSKQGVIIYDPKINSSVALNTKKSEVIKQVLVEKSGNVLVMSNFGLYRYDSNLNFINDLTSDRGFTKEVYGLGMATHPNGKVILVNHTGFYQVEEDRLRRLNSRDSSYQIGSRAFVIDNNGDYWYGTKSNGLFLQLPDQIVNWNNESILPKGEITSIYKDQEQNIWIGINGGGLVKLNQNFVSKINKDQGLDDDRVLALHNDNLGSIWIGTNGGSLYQMNSSNQSLKEWTATTEGSLEDVWSIASDLNGNAWFGSYGHGLSFYNAKENRIEPVSYWNEEIDVVLAMIYDTVNNRLLVGGDGGALYEFKDNAWRCLVSEKEIGARITQIILSEDGKVFLTTTLGVKSYSSGKLEDYAITGDLSQISVRCMFKDTEGTIFLGTYGHGLIIVKNGKTIQLDKNNGLYDNIISSLYLDDFGYLWFSCNNGVFKVLKSSILDYITTDFSKPLSVEVFNQSHGMGSSETNGGFQPAVTFTDEDLILYPTMKGIAVFDPHKRSRSEIKNTIVTGVKFNEIFHSHVDGVEIPPKHRDLEFYFTAPEFTSPELLKFEYFLQGYDTYWHEAGIGRTAKYTRLAPGNYSFLVRVRNSQGIISGRTAKANVILKPFFYETKAFFIVLGLIGVGLVGLLFFIQKKRSERKELELKILVDARTEDLKKEKELTQNKNKELKTQSEKIERMSNAKTNFFQNVSHELKTPLTLIKGPVEHILKTHGNNIGLDFRKDIILIKNQSDILNNLISELLDIARSESEGLVKKESILMVNQLFRSVIEQFNSLAQQKNISLDVEIPDLEIVVWMDGLLLQKIVSNLVSNAIKFTPEGGKVKVGVEHNEDRLSFIVEDSGEGVSSEKMDLIFKRFYSEGNDIDKNDSGTGIGLSLVRDYARALEGDVHVSSSLLGGACFKVDVYAKKGIVSNAPVPMEEQSRIDSEIIDEENSLLPRVLVVDDHPEIRSLIKRELSSSFEVFEAENGQEGLERVRQLLPDLVLSDIMMPVMDGIEMLKNIKNSSETNFIPVLLLTARGSDPIKMESWKTGAEGFISKPFNLSELKYRALGVLENRKWLKNRYSFIPWKDKKSGADSFEEKFRQLVAEEIPNSDFSFTSAIADFGMSQTKFTKMVKDKFGSTPQVYLRNARLDHAFKLLQQKEGGISEIAYASGFNSVSYFDRIFKSKFNNTPSYYWESL